jgi:predicted MFS family arabinose efflux permease
MHKYADKLGEKKVLMTIGIIAVSSLVLSVANIGYWGYIVILAIYASEQVLNPYMSEVLNTHSPENQRATVLSVASFFKSLPYVLLAPAIGYLNNHNKIEYFFIIWAVAIFIALLVYLSAKKRDSFIALP